MPSGGYPEPTGCAKITKGYNLPARYVLHTVGPIVHDGKPTPEQEKELTECYQDYFVITTNVDGKFEKSEFDSGRIFAVQGDYAYLQCAFYEESS